MLRQTSTHHQEDTAMCRVRLQIESKEGAPGIAYYCAHILMRCIFLLSIAWYLWGCLIYSEKVCTFVLSLFLFWMITIIFLLVNGHLCYVAVKCAERWPQVPSFWSPLLNLKKWDRICENQQHCSWFLVLLHFFISGSSKWLRLLVLLTILLKVLFFGTVKSSLHYDAPSRTIIIKEF